MNGENAAQGLSTPSGTPNGGDTRRDFLYLTTGTVATVGAAVAAWPLLDNMNPSADVLALSSVVLDLEPIAVGQRITVSWRGQPLFISHRTRDEIAKAKADDAADLRDPEPDSARVQHENWLVVVGICTHLGCIPLGQKPNDPRGEWDGWFCPCHGSHYDTSGRIRKGPAPTNLVVPHSAFLESERVRVG